MAWETDGNATEALFNEATACAMLCSRPRLPGAVDAIFETGQLLGADRAAGVKLPVSYPDFRTEAEFAAVGELGRRVMQHDRRIDLVEKLAGGACIFRHDRIGVMRTVICEYARSPRRRRSPLGGDDRVLIFGIQSSSKPASPWDPRAARRRRRALRNRRRSASRPAA